MNLTQFRYFAAVAQNMSFSKAADLLFISQSALSKAIRSLETELKTDLFIRSGKKLALTRSGEVLLPYAIEMVQHFDRSCQQVMHQLGLSNEKLVIGIPPTAGFIFFHLVIQRFREAYPDTELVIEEGASKSVVKQLMAMQQDLGVVIEPCLNDRLIKYPVVQSEAVAVVPKTHPLANRGTIDLAELKDEQFFTISENFMFHDIVRDKCKEAGFEPKINFTNSHWEWVFVMVMEGLGISILPYPLVKPFLNDKVQILHLQNPTFPWVLSMCYHQDSILSDAAKKFISIAKSEALRLQTTEADNNQAPIKTETAID